MLTLYKSLVILHLDYCSHLCAQIDSGSIQDIEMVQKNFLKKIHGFNTLTYWERLKHFKIYSLQRRRERYAVIYIWKIIEELVPNFTHLENGVEMGGVNWYHHIRLGRKCKIQGVKSSTFQRVRYASLALQGPKLFNSLPKHIRNLSCNVDEFKRKLDKFFSDIPDEPLLKNYVKFRRANSNSIIDMMGIGLNELDA